MNFVAEQGTCKAGSLQSRVAYLWKMTRLIEPLSIVFFHLQYLKPEKQYSTELEWNTQREDALSCLQYFRFGHFPKYKRGKTYVLVYSMGKFAYASSLLKLGT